MSSNVRIWSARICLVVYLLASLCGSKELVLCVGADGHVGVEQASTIACTGCESASQDAPTDADSRLESGSDDCGCVDIPTWTACTAVMKKLAFPAAHDAGLAAIGLSVRVVREPVLANVPTTSAPPPRPPAELETIRTVVLRA